MFSRRLSARALMTETVWPLGRAIELPIEVRVRAVPLVRGDGGNSLAPAGRATAIDVRIRLMASSQLLPLVQAGVASRVTLIAPRPRWLRVGPPTWLWLS